ncbi:TasA family protein [Halorarius halobius]|uniref:TasA family protein n=1 Tax=Halorarius halobius TaxID=2962671 RepID=UPI0020CF130B|nr:TasA family protein [Halorarius halobius]
MSEDHSQNNVVVTRRRALVALGTIGVGSAAAGAGTFAAFSDTETTSTGDFSAGELNLKLGQDDSLSFSATDIVPGDSGSSFADVNNTGGVNGTLTVSVTGVSGTDNTGSEFETVDDGSELPDNLELKMWLDSPSSTDGTFDSASDYGLRSDGTVAHQNNTNSSVSFATARSYDGVSWSPSVDLVNNEYKFYVSYQLPSGTGNKAQGDTATVDYKFELKS